MNLGHHNMKTTPLELSLSTSKGDPDPMNTYNEFKMHCDLCYLI